MYHNPPPRPQRNTEQFKQPAQTQSGGSGGYKRNTMDPAVLSSNHLYAKTDLDIGRGSPPLRSPPPTPPPARSKAYTPFPAPINSGRPLPRPPGGSPSGASGNGITNGYSEPYASRPQLPIKPGTHIGGYAPTKPAMRPVRPPAHQQSSPAIEIGVKPKPLRRRSLDLELKLPVGGFYGGGGGASYDKSPQPGGGSGGNMASSGGERVKTFISKAIGDVSKEIRKSKGKEKEKNTNGYESSTSTSSTNGNGKMHHSTEGNTAYGGNGHFSLPAFVGPKVVGSASSSTGNLYGGSAIVPSINIPASPNKGAGPMSAHELSRGSSGRIPPVRPPTRTPSAPSPGGTLRGKETPHERRTKICNEMLDTEETYVQALHTLMEVYERPLYSVCERTPAVTKNGIRLIFSTLPQIIGVNDELLRQLRARMAGWDERKTIGDIFVTMAPFLKIYKDYENDYGTALETYTQYMRDPEFLATIDRCDTDSRVALRLESCLITPIQRIPRYKLLLEDLVKHTPPEHADAPLLKQALAKMEEVAIFIDDYLKESEQRLRLIELAGQSGASVLLAPHRKLIREDEVKVKADSNQTSKGKTLQLLMFNDILVACPQSKLVKLGLDKKNGMINKRNYHWPLNLIWLKDEDPSLDGQTIELTGPGRVYTLRFVNVDTKNSWVRELRSATEKLLGSFNLGDRREGMAFFKNSLSYKGEWFRGKTHGKGDFSIYGTTYSGQVEKDVKTGYGTMTFANQETYVGEWHDDLPHGQGKMVYPGGHHYEGSWRAGRRSGKGVMKYANGDIYDGFWEDNYPHGHGVLACINGTKYDGNWADGVFHGLGQLTLPNGKEYNGNWVAGQRDGHGSFRHYHFSNKDIVIEEYVGSWMSDQKHGIGALTNADGTYQGMFEAGKKEGQGDMRYADKTTYSGLWKQNQRHGMGTLFCPSDTGARIKRYEGEWKFDKKDGKGTADFWDGSRYEGSFKADLFHGTGAMSVPDGSIRVECKWEKGLRVGPAKVNFKGGILTERDRELVGVVRDPLITTKKCTYPLAPPLPLLQADNYQL